MVLLRGYLWGRGRGRVLAARREDKPHCECQTKDTSFHKVIIILGGAGAQPRKSLPPSTRRAFPYGWRRTSHHAGIHARACRECETARTCAPCRRAVRLPRWHTVARRRPASTLTASGICVASKTGSLDVLARRGDQPRHLVLNRKCHFSNDSHDYNNPRQWANRRAWPRRPSRPEPQPKGHWQRRSSLGALIAIYVNSNGTRAASPRLPALLRCDYFRKTKEIRRL
jgi:hypothetical protein